MPEASKEPVLPAASSAKIQQSHMSKAAPCIGDGPFSGTARSAFNEKSLVEASIDDNLDEAEQETGNRLGPNAKAKAKAKAKANAKDGPVAWPANQKPINKELATKVIWKVKSVGRKAVAELKSFHAFVSHEYLNYALAFEAIAPGAKTVDFENFTQSVSELGFKGHAERVFYSLCDEISWDNSLSLSRTAFLQRLATMGNLCVLMVQRAVAVFRTISKEPPVDVREQRRQSFTEDPNMHQLLRQLRKFLRNQFSTPSNAYEDITSCTTCCTKTEFHAWLDKINYPHDRELIFDTLSCSEVDGEGCIERDMFIAALIGGKSKKGADEDPQGNMVAPSGEVPQVPVTRSQLVKRSMSTASLDSAAADEPASRASSKSKETTEKSKFLKRSSSVASLASTSAFIEAKPAPPKGMRRSASTASLDSKAAGAYEASNKKNSKKGFKRSTSTASLESQAEAAFEAENKEHDEVHRSKPSGSPKYSVRRSNSTASLKSLDSNIGGPSDTGSPKNGKKNKLKRSGSLQSMDSKADNGRKAAPSPSSKKESGKISGSPSNASGSRLFAFTKGKKDQDVAQRSATMFTAGTGTGGKAKKLPHSRTN